MRWPHLPDCDISAPLSPNRMPLQPGHDFGMTGNESGSPYMRFVMVPQQSDQIHSAAIYSCASSGIPQISSEYSRMVLSVENLPMRATLRIAIRVQIS